MDWLQFLKEFGFPALCCGGLGWFVVFQTRNFKDELKEFRNSLSELRKSREEDRKAREEESKQTLAALNNNTLALQKLTDRLDNERKPSDD